MSTLLITHPDCLDHLTPLGHPERPERLRAIENALEIEKFQSLARVQAPKAPLDVIALCHPMEYITQISEATPMLGIVHLDADTSMSPGTFEAALRAAGGAVHAVDEVMSKKAANAFVATRPPGHHAETARPMGFCIFDNAAIAARYAQKRYGIARAAIVDFDVHHGNGSQEIFWADKTVMYCSTTRCRLSRYRRGVTATLLVVATDPSRTRASPERSPKSPGPALGPRAPIPAASRRPWLSRRLQYAGRPMALGRGEGASGCTAAARRVAGRACGCRLDAHGHVGDADPVQAVEDALRTFAAQEVVFVTGPDHHQTSTR